MQSHFSLLAGRSLPTNVVQGMSIWRQQFAPDKPVAVSRTDENAFSWLVRCATISPLGNDRLKSFRRLTGPPLALALQSAHEAAIVLVRTP